MNSNISKTLQIEIQKLFLKRKSWIIRKKTGLSILQSENWAKAKAHYELERELRWEQTIQLTFQLKKIDGKTFVKILKTRYLTLIRMGFLVHP
jgi:hypothetical protein